MTTSASSATMKKATDVSSKLTAGRPRVLVSIEDAFLVRCCSSHRPYGPRPLVSTPAVNFFIPNDPRLSAPPTSLAPRRGGPPAVQLALQRRVAHGPLGPRPRRGRLGRQAGSLQQVGVRRGQPRGPGQRAGGGAGFPDPPPCARDRGHALP